jgi:tRNA(Ile)-lysidine synthase
MSLAILVDRFEAATRNQVPARNSWVDRVKRRLARWCDLGRGKTWVVAVSGGGDSVGLLRILHQLADPVACQLSVAHLDHGARGAAARDDAQFVAELAASLDLPFDLGTWKPTRSSHFESDARAARYGWLTQVARHRGASFIAVGHTSDDQAETILHRIIRGTGLRGLRGMPTTRVLTAGPKIVLARPLLTVSRREVRDFLAAIGQPFREDESNASLSRTRARIRHDLLPKLAAEYNSSVANALVQLGSLASSCERAHEDDLNALEQSVVVARAPDRYVLKHSALRSVPAFLRAEVLRRLWRSAGWPEAGMSARRWRWLAALVASDNPARADVGAGVEISTDLSTVVLRRALAPAAAARPAATCEPIALATPGVTDVPWAGGSIDAQIDSGPASPGDEAIDLDSVSPPLFVRAPEPGDRFDPLGMGGHRTPLADFFRGRHVPREQRNRTPLVCDQQGIIWVVGHRIADRVKINEKTGRALRLSWRENGAGGEIVP